MDEKDICSRIGYDFKNVERLKLAFKLAHRSDDDEGDAYEGNRGIAELGEYMMGAVEVQGIVWDGDGRRKSATKRKSWTRTRREQAEACRALKLDRYIVPSARQRDKPLSQNVLSITMRAIIGAMWIDMGEQDLKVTEVTQKLAATLRYIAEALPDTEDERHSQQSPQKVQAHYAECGTASGPSNGNTTSTSSKPLTASSSSPQEVEIEQSIVPSTASAASATYNQMALRQASNSGSVKSSTSNETTPVKALKRKSFSSSGSDDEVRLQELITEEQAKLSEAGNTHLLCHDQVIELGRNKIYSTSLEILYFAIGSTQSLVHFKRALAIARAKSTNPFEGLRRDMSGQQTLQAIRTLKNTTAVCNMLRRCHVWKLYSEELITHKMHTMTSADFELGGVRVEPGNAKHKLKSNVTESMMQILAPNVIKHTSEYNRTRREIAGLRRLGSVLHALANRFDFGVLALLSLQTIEINDTMLLSIPEGVLHQFLELVDRYQGPMLRNLSQRMSPILDAFMYDDLVSHELFDIEYMETQEIEKWPKGTVHFM